MSKARQRAWHWPTPPPRICFRFETKSRAIHLDSICAFMARPRVKFKLYMTHDQCINRMSTITATKCTQVYLAAYLCAFVGTITAYIWLHLYFLTLSLLTWRIWWAPNNASNFNVYYLVTHVWQHDTSLFPSPQSPTLTHERLPVLCVCVDT